MRLTEFIKRNLLAKVLSLFLATLIWLSIQTSADRLAGSGGGEKIQVAEERSGTAPIPTTLVPTAPKQEPSSTVGKSEPFDRPVTLLKPPGDSYVYRIDPSEVTIVVKGDKQLLQDMNTREIQVFVDLTDKLDRFATAANTRGIPAHIRAYSPAGVEVSRIEPSLASVTRISRPEPAGKPDATATNTSDTATHSMPLGNAAGSTAEAPHPPAITAPGPREVHFPTNQPGPDAPEAPGDSSPNPNP